MVVSKFPLPNYRPDLDDRRPQREVIIAGRSWELSILLIL